MSDADRPLDPVPATPDPLPPLTVPRVRGRLGRATLFGATLVVGVALGAGGLAAAAVGPGGWHGGPPLARIQAFVERAFDAVGATSQQEAKAHDIVAATFKDFEPMRARRDALRKEAIAILTAPTIDRAAAEKLRADHMAELDQASKRLVTALADLADVLTPEQRAAMAERAKDFAERGPRHGWRD